MPGLLLVTPPGPDADALCANLKDRGFDVHQASNGAAAVDVAFRRQPDAILMDPSLSAMDRWHAVKRLNTEPSTSRIPVLTLVSDATSPGGLQRVLAKIERTLGSLPVSRPPVVDPPLRSTDPGADRLARSARGDPGPATVDLRPPAEGGRPHSQPPTIAPPVRTPQLPPVRSSRTPTTPSARTPGAAPAAVMVPRGGESAAPAPRPADPVSPTAATPLMAQRDLRPRQAVILVVDDNAMNRDMLSRRLERKGYAVEVAESGEQALELLQRRRFDLVLLDWMMPGLSGIDVLRKLREQFAAIQLPVIMATAKSEADDIVEALRADANDYVTKPLNFDVVHARIRTQLNLVEAHRELVASERRYRALLENTGDMIVQFRTSGQVLYVSPASRTLLGWEPDELKQRSFYDWMHPIDRRALEEQQRTQATLPPAYTFLTRMQRQDQSWIWVETSCRLLREEGSLVVQAACRDVTEHMERLAGDEPPLPLGGDIMAHPGWRGAMGTSKPPAPERESAPEAAARPSPAPVVVTVVVGESQATPEEIGRQVAEQLASVWKGT